MPPLFGLKPKSVCNGSIAPIPNASHYPKADVAFEQLDAQAVKMSDNEAALALNNASKKLFKDIPTLRLISGLKNTGEFYVTRFVYIMRLCR